MEPSISSSGSVADAMNLIKSGRFQDAIHILKALAADSPADAQAYACLGIAYTQTGEKEMAIAAFEKSLSLRETPKAHYNLGLAYETANMKERAVKSFQSALSLDPDYSLALQALERLAPEPEPAAAGSAPSAEDFRLVDMGPSINEITRVSETQPVPEQPAFIGQVPDFGSQNALPDIAREDAEKAMRFAEQRKEYMKSSLGYGVICGSLFMLACKFLLMFFGFGLGISSKGSFVAGLIGTGIEGGILGGLIGLWIGYTCGDDMQGLFAGAVLGGVVGLITGLLTGAGLMTLFLMVLNAFLLGVFGLFVGRMVESSIN